MVPSRKKYQVGLQNPAGCANCSAYIQSKQRCLLFGHALALMPTVVGDLRDLYLLQVVVGVDGLSRSRQPGPPVARGPPPLCGESSAEVKTFNS